MSEGYEIVVPELPIKMSALVCEEIDESTYVYINENDGATMTLNATASAVFDMCDGKTSDKDMAAMISETLDVGYDDALRDVRDVLKELSGFGFVHA